MEECETGDITYKWTLTFPKLSDGVISNFDYGMPDELQTTMCDPDKMTTTTTTTRSTTTSSTTTIKTTTLPTADSLGVNSFTENSTGTVYLATQDSTGTIVVSFDDGTPEPDAGNGNGRRRRKRQIGGTVEMGEAQETLSLIHI